MENIKISFYKYVPDGFRMAVKFIISSLAVVGTTYGLYFILETLSGKADGPLETKIYMLVEAFIFAFLTEIRWLSISTEQKRKMVHVQGLYNGVLAALSFMLVVNGDIFGNWPAFMVVIVIMAVLGDYSIMNDLKPFKDRRKRGLLGRVIYIIDLDNFQKFGGVVSDISFVKKHLLYDTYKCRLKFGSNEIDTEYDEYSCGAKLIPEFTGKSTAFWNSYEEESIRRESEEMLVGSTLSGTARMIYTIVNIAFLIIVPGRAVSFIVTNYLSGDEGRLLASISFTLFAGIFGFLLIVIRPYLYILNSFEEK
ncbi:MAG: hypothetical protein K6B41_01715 [Butyrivibrio sp.]|nr:hypothetical protein [Butyrivibrio sp.]